MPTPTIRLGFGETGAAKKKGGAAPQRAGDHPPPRGLTSLRQTRLRKRRRRRGENRFVQRSRPPRGWLVCFDDISSTGREGKEEKKKKKGAIRSLRPPTFTRRRAFELARAREARDGEAPTTEKEGGEEGERRENCTYFSLRSSLFPIAERNAGDLPARAAPRKNEI